MISARSDCAQCGVEIVDPTTRVVQTSGTFCCANCSAAMDATGSGSDPKAMRHDESLRCEHCGVPIVHEATMETRGNEAYCCANCARAGSMGLGTPGLADTAPETA